ncbi:MAG: hypothetical protein HY551_06635, partial [Elusimicrobia bacterium]|nr:hypothetical protein [Elusimicrobiota bacterium]
MARLFSIGAALWLLGAGFPSGAPARASERTPEDLIEVLKRTVDLMQDPAFEPAREKTKAAIEKASRADPRHRRRVLAESLSSEVVPLLTESRTLRSVPERTRNQVDNALSDILIQV